VHGGLLARAREQGPLADPLAAALVEDNGEALRGGSAASPGWESQEILAAQFADEGALAVMTAPDGIEGADRPVRQAVLLGPGGCSRSHRLPWPPFSSIFRIGCAEQQMLDAAGSRLWQGSRPRGCVLVPMNLDFSQAQDLGGLLLEKGYRSDRQSVWVLQGLQWSNSGPERKDFLELVHVASSCAALGSVLVAEVPFDLEDTEAAMATLGFLGRAVSLADAGLKYDRAYEGGGDGCFSLFVGRQTNRSVGERDTYQAHLRAAEETDEDFFDNFS
jgi:O-methyltransferase involved in polyketide biosynthesis